jgi:Tol biopolymer transport system component
VFPLYGTGTAAGIALKDLESADEPEVVLEDSAIPTPFDWTPDEAAILFSRPTGSAFELGTLGLHDRTTRILLGSKRPITGVRLSPDGRWIAYTSADSGRREVYVTDFPAAKLRKPVSIDGGFAPVWAPDGKELFFVSGGRMMAAAVRSGTAIDFERSVPLFEGLDVAGNQTPFAVAPDGRFLMVEPAPGGATRIGQVTLVLNWFNELNRLLPTR